MLMKSVSERLRPWPTIWLWFLLAIIALGIVTPSNPLLTIIKLTGIALCFVYALQRFPRDYLLHAAMLLTFIADICLALATTSSDLPIFFTNHAASFGVMELGVLVFLSVQIIHLGRLSTPRDFDLSGLTFPEQLRHFLNLSVNLASISFHFTIRDFCLTTIIITGANLCLGFMPTIFLLAAFYATALISNVVLGYHWWKSTDALPALCAFIGFILFLCCDTCTGVSYLASIGTFSLACKHIADFAAWLFYYPSQVFIANSAKNRNPLPESKKCAKIITKGR